MVVSQQAMQALANSNPSTLNGKSNDQPDEGNLRAKGQSRIEKTLQVPEVQELVACLSDATERAGFEPAVQALPVRRFSKPLP